jgi:hypothetical protein
MVHTPRSERDVSRMRRTAETADGEAMPAMAEALAQIGTAFDEAATINAFKMKIDRLIQLGPDHPAVRARFGGRAAMLSGRNLDVAVFVVERWWRDERKAFQITSAFGRATRLSLEILSELRLILRLMRRKRMDAEYKVIVSALCDVPTAIAAE